MTLRQLFTHAHNNSLPPAVRANTTLRPLRAGSYRGSSGLSIGAVQEVVPTEADARAEVKAGIRVIDVSQIDGNVRK